MTYWPISSPSVFAATKNTRNEGTQTSHDGVESSTHVQHGDDERKEGGISRKDDEAPTEQLMAEDDVSGEILAIKVTRSGHMFATITTSTLTIWQTKACLAIQAMP
jgi:hypothetical protein